MPESQLDSLKAIYCTPERTSAIEAYKDAREDKLMELTSAEDVAKFYSFVNEYVSVGGRSGKMLEKASENTHPIIQLGMAIAAASVDEMLADYPITRIDYGCLEEVLKSNSLDITFDVLEDTYDVITIEDPMSVVNVLLNAGMEIHEIIKIKEQYDLCCAGRWH